MKPSLVTGGAGFIGSALVRMLSESGPVRVLDDLSTGRRSNVASDVTFIEGSVLDQRAVAAAIDGVDTVYHLACLGVRQSIHDPRRNVEVNAIGTLNVLEACRAIGPRRLVYTSTSEVYGSAVEVPMTERHPTLPHTAYGASKLAGEALVRSYHRTYGLPVVVVRPFNAFGPRSHHEGDSGEVIPRFLVRAMNGIRPLVFGDGLQTRDFTYVDDTATALMAAAQEPAAVGETLNVGSGTEVSIADLATLVLKVAERPDLGVEHQPERPGDIRRLLADSSAARAMLRWEPRVDLETGLRRLLEWHIEQDTDWELAMAEEEAINWAGTPR